MTDSRVTNPIGCMSEGPLNAYTGSTSKYLFLRSRCTGVLLVTKELLAPYRNYIIRLLIVPCFFER